MIDTDLVNTNAEHCLKQLAGRQHTEFGNLYQVNNFFTRNLIEKLVLYINATTLWQPVELQEYLNRSAIVWDPDTVFEETYMIFDRLTDYLNDLFGQDLKLTGIQLWRDSPGYIIPMHVDNNRIGYSMQIYLTDGVEQLGTYFNTLEIPYKINTGYVTSAAQKIQHGMIKPVPNDHTRYSVYAIWA